MATSTGSMTAKEYFMVVVSVVFPIIPIFLFDHLPLVDYPNHLAELEIRKTIASNVNIATFYGVRWLFTPDLGLNLLATPLLPFLSVEIVGRVVIIFAFSLICVSTILLDRELNQGKWGLSLFTGIFLYNGAFMWGFISYVIGIGVAILSFWIWVRHREKAVGIGIIGFSVLGLIVCIMHFYAFIIYGICVGGYECSVFFEKLKIERRVRMSLFKIPFGAVVSLLVPLLAVIWLSPVSSNFGQTIWGLEEWDSPAFWTSLVKWKAEVFASPILTRQMSFEKPLLIATLVIFVLALATRTIVVNARMVVPLATIGMIVMFMPNKLVGWWFADYHLPSGVTFFALASIRWRETSRARVEMVRLLLVVCLIVRVGSVLLAWRPAQAIIEEYDMALQLVPPGSRLLVLTGSVDNMLFHVPVLAAAKQGIFVPYTWTGESLVKVTNLLTVLPKYRDYLKDSPTSPSSSVNNIRKYDYLLEVGKPEATIPTGISLHEVERGPNFTLYRIDQVAVR